MTAALIIGALALAGAWTPILIRFFRAWRGRHNPVSLAICGVILLVIYANVVAIGVYAFNGDALWASIAVFIFNAVSCVNFYWAFYRSQKRFVDARLPRPLPPPPKE